MIEFPNNPEDVGAQMSTTGDEWEREDDMPLDYKLNDNGIELRDGELYSVYDGRPTLLGPVDFQEFGIIGIKYYSRAIPGFVDEYSDGVMVIVYDAYTEVIWDDREEGWVEMGGL